MLATLEESTTSNSFHAVFTESSNNCKLDFILAMSAVCVIEPPITFLFVFSSQEYKKATIPRRKIIFFITIKLFRMVNVKLRFYKYRNNFKNKKPSQVACKGF